MSAPLFDSRRALFTKTALGQQEIQSRAQGLSPITRRLLILIDGKRSFQELTTFVTGHDLGDLLSELQTKACIEVAAGLRTANATSVAEAPVAPAPHPVDPVTTSTSHDLAKLPEASTRTAKDVDMARHFMVNTINAVFPLNYQVNLLEAISACTTAQDVRRVYPQWAETIGSDKTGGKRLPEFRIMLFEVL